MNHKRFDSRRHHGEDAYKEWSSERWSPDNRHRKQRSQSPPPPSRRWNVRRKIVSVSPESLKYHGGHRGSVDVGRRERKRSQDLGNRLHYSMSPRSTTGRRGPYVSPERRKGDRTAHREVYHQMSRRLDENRKRKNPSPLPGRHGKSPPISSGPPMHARDKEDLYMVSSQRHGSTRGKSPRPYDRIRSYTTPSVGSSRDSRRVPSVSDKNARRNATGGVSGGGELSSTDNVAFLDNKHEMVGKRSPVRSGERVKEAGGLGDEGLEQDGGQQGRQKQQKELGMHDTGWGVVEVGGLNWGDTEKDDSSRQIAGDDPVNDAVDVGKSKEMPSSPKGEELFVQSSSKSGLEEEGQTTSAASIVVGGNGGGSGDGEGLEQRKSEKPQDPKQQQELSVQDAGWGNVESGGHNWGDNSNTIEDPGQVLRIAKDKENTVVAGDDRENEMEKTASTTENDSLSVSCGMVENASDDTTSRGRVGGLEHKQCVQEEQQEKRRENQQQLGVQDTGWGFIEAGGHSWGGTEAKNETKQVLEGEDPRDDEGVGERKSIGGATCEDTVGFGTSGKGHSSTAGPKVADIKASLSNSIGDKGYHRVQNRERRGNQYKDEVHMLMNSSLSSQRKTTSHSSSGGTGSTSLSSKRSPLHSSQVRGIKGTGSGSSSSVSVGRGRGRGAVMPAWMASCNGKDSKSDIGKLKRKRSRSRDRSRSPRGRSGVYSEPPPLREKGGSNNSSSRWGERPRMATHDNRRNRSAAAIGGGSETRRSIQDYSPDRQSRKKRNRNDNDLSIASSKPQLQEMVDRRQAATARTERSVVKRGTRESAMPAWMTSMKEEKNKSSTATAGVHSSKAQESSISSAVEGNSAARGTDSLGNTNTMGDLNDIMARELEKERKGLPPSWEVAFSEVCDSTLLYLLLLPFLDTYLTSVTM